MPMMQRPTGTNSMGNRTGGDSIPKGYAKGQLQQFTPEQMQLFQHAFSHVGPDSYLSKLAGGDEGTFNQLEAPALKQFAGLQDNLASRFSGAGSGARRSSSFQNASGQLGSDFAEKLQSQRVSLQQQAIKDLLGMSNDLLGQRPYEQFLIKKQNRPSAFGRALGIGLPLAGAGIGGFLGGPMGAALGGSLGSTAASGFTGNESQNDYSSFAGLPTSWS